MITITIHYDTKHDYQLAAEEGLANAQNNLAALYDFGRGVTQDYDEAASLYRLAAD